MDLRRMEVCPRLRIRRKSREETAIFPEPASRVLWGLDTPLMAKPTGLRCTDRTAGGGIFVKMTRAIRGEIMRDKREKLGEWEKKISWLKKCLATVKYLRDPYREGCASAHQDSAQRGVIPRELVTTILQKHTKG